ncbi:uncharacterized protein LAESUDRAFT_734322 [Laetiporus sulphureus 93-53]|uniref:Exonuclease domain-containing protein n=1 Tax=Laetiporus sulphureus 93-53 TaxID=1314785 RepID=A0A165HAR5_9APHY|nr:uncharacterized protein LAESUDRAFT_734322 [Laetiporus sulphureus 93-53]KZT11478.1 hypothetical protein LAESUDRAFT_734322 [Laetiporus sulphureus 93-53]
MVSIFFSIWPSLASGLPWGCFLLVVATFVLGERRRQQPKASSEPSPLSEMQKLSKSQNLRQIQECQAARQPYDAFLVLNVEGTCVEGSAAFDYPNEIIEWPVCLLRWQDKDEAGTAKKLQVVDEFRSFVKPTWRPRLSKFCTQLTGITQEQVDSAPTFTELSELFKSFMERNALIEPITGRRLIRYCWCSDGPYDVRDFVVKQCFISKPNMTQSGFHLPTRITLTIPRQLQVLGLGPFEGRQHSGIDDARNIARILIELAKRGVRIQTNTTINPNKRWPWMGRRGKILDNYH